MPWDGPDETHECREVSGNEDEWVPWNGSDETRESWEPSWSWDNSVPINGPIADSWQ